jgi:hypothetical protein
MLDIFSFTTFFKFLVSQIILFGITDDIPLRAVSSIVRSIEFVIKVGAGTEAVGLFESIHLFVYKLMLQNSISGVKRRVCLCLEHFQHLL